MKPSDFLTALVFFFNDFIGAVVPGFIFIAGLDLADIYPTKIVHLLISVMPQFSWVLLLFFAYAVGHGLLGIHRLLQPIIGAPLRGIHHLVLYGRWDVCVFDRIIVEGAVYKEFLSEIKRQHKINKENLSKIRFEDVRNIAMTISKEASELARRFMFISLFCYGISMAIALIAISWVISLQEILSSSNMLPIGLISIIFFIFYIRALEFEFRAQNVPFSVALAELGMASNKNESKK